MDKCSICKSIHFFGEGDKPQNGMIRGYTWKIKLFNGAIFEWWTPEGKSTRRQAKLHLMDIANGGRGSIYKNIDIENIWRTKG